MGGLMSVTGLPGHGPVRAGTAIADITAGLYCAMGVLAALLEREVSGEGQWVDSSLLAAQVAVMDFQAARWTVDREVAPQAGNDHPLYMPTGMFETGDGFINIAASGDTMFARLCEALGTAHLLDDPRFARRARAAAPTRRAQRCHRGGSRAPCSNPEWSSDNGAGRALGPVYSLDPPSRTRRSSISHGRAGRPSGRGGRIELGRPPVRFHRTPWQLRNACPEMGEHTDSILAGLGYGEDEIERLRERGVL